VTHSARVRGSRSAGETELIQLLQAQLQVGRARGVQLGIGDDAAVLDLRGRHVWSVDDSVEGVHFDLGWVDLATAARRAVHAAASDLAAMGAAPVAALCSLQLPRKWGRAEVGRIARGQARASRELELPIVGGNISAGDVLRFTTTVLGRAGHPLTRSGAQPGDEVWLFGEVGLAACGLLSLQHELDADGLPRRQRRAVNAARAAWRQPLARIKQGGQLIGRASAAVDVSDGLATESLHLARASSVCVELDERKLREVLHPDLIIGAQLLGADPLALALAGGEDYALLATGPEQRRPPLARVLGQITPGAPRVTLRTTRGRRRAIRGGHDHFRVTP
jgi:thiamine-monophosphate kinase